MRELKNTACMGVMYNNTDSADIYITNTGISG